MQKPLPASAYQHASGKNIASLCISMHQGKRKPFSASACIREQESLSLHQYTSRKNIASPCISMHQGKMKPFPASACIKER
jgi:hypothetical protein